MMEVYFRVQTVLSVLILVPFAVLLWAGVFLLWRALRKRP